MTRNLKTLSLSLAAILAMSAITASAVQAAETETAEFSWSAGTTTLDTTQDPTAPSFKFTTTAGTSTCDETISHAVVTGTGARTTTKTGITFDDKKTREEGSPNNCTGPLGVKLAINLNGCHFVIHAGTTDKPTIGETEGTLGILCLGASKFIELKWVGCTTKIPEQGLEEEKTLGPVTFKNVKTGAKEEITVTTEIGQRPSNEHNRAFTSTHTGAACGTGEDKTGTIEGRVTIKGTDALGNQTDITVT